MRGIQILRTSALRGSEKFADRNSHMAYKDSPFGGCVYYLMLATVMALYNPAGLTSPALLYGRSVAVKQVMSTFGLERVTVLKVALLATTAVLAACLVALAGMEKPAEAAFPGVNGKISFAGSDGDIHSMNADGTGHTNLTNTGFPAPEDANWSSDGTRIVFQRQGDIWEMNADGSNRTNLTNTPSIGEQHPTYSPDDTKIAFSSLVDHFQIHVMNADGSGRTSLTDTVGDLYPAWSPDGTKIAFQSHRALDNTARST